MKDFTFYSPTKILFGASQFETFLSELKKISSNILIITGGGSVEKLGYLKKLENALNEKSINFGNYKGIEPNPLSQTINKAAKFGKEKKIDAVLALGGGSTMDAAKAISALIKTNEEDIWPFVLGEEKFLALTGALPIIAIPTTAATASEVTPYSVISNKEVNGKAPIAYDFLKPTLSWINPEFTADVPLNVTQDGASDILSHVFENYLLGGNDSILTDRYCESIIKTVIETLPELLKDQRNLEHRGTLLWCSTLALNGMQGAGRNPSDFILHSIEHMLSAFNHKLAHGRGLATLYPAYFKWLWNNGRAKDKLTRLGKIVFNIEENSNSGLQFIERFESWLKENSLLQSVEDIGISKDLYKQVAQKTVDVYGDGSQLNALGPLKVKDIVDILTLTESQKS